MSELVRHAGNTGYSSKLLAFLVIPIFTLLFHNLLLILQQKYSGAQN